MSELWVKRRAEADDESALVYLWLKGYAHARRNVARGANRDGSDAERLYWREHAPIVEFLLRKAEVTVLCDPARAEASSAGPAVIFAFACTSGDVVHWIGVKRLYAREGYGPDMVRELLGERLQRPCTFTHELAEMRPNPTRPAPCGVALPASWTEDPWWLSRQLLGGARAA